MVSECLREDQKLQSVGFLLNLSGVPEKQYKDIVIPRYCGLLQDMGIAVRQVLLGSYDSFVLKTPQKTKGALRKFLQTHEEGISIQLCEDRVRVSPFTAENCLSAGVSWSARQPFEPVFPKITQKRQILAEFEALIQGSSTEAELEEFLVTHYRDIFGPRYDRVETQILLRFPELDIGGKDRRFDLFLRDSVIGDWELHELKRVAKLTGTYRDVPVITQEVQHAIQQVRNYSRILAQDAVKRKFASEGIEYFEPSLNLIIGKSPQIPHEQWRWLMTTHGRDVRIVTFDELLRESRERLRDRESFLNLSNSVFEMGQHSGAGDS